MKIERVGHLPIRTAIGTRLGFGDPFVGHRVRTEVVRCAVIEKATRTLQPLHERCHRGHVEVSGIEPLKADAIGLLFVLTRVVELHLQRDTLRRSDGEAVDAKLGPLPEGTGRPAMLSTAVPCASTCRLSQIGLLRTNGDGVDLHLDAAGENLVLPRWSVERYGDGEVFERVFGRRLVIG